MEERDSISSLKEQYYQEKESIKIENSKLYEKMEGS